MATISIISTASRDAYPALLAGLQAQYGHAGAVELATHFLEAEAADFHWESRVAERWLGTCECADDGAELARIAIAGELRQVWFVAICLVDGDGAVETLHDVELVSGPEEAHAALARMR
jgi:hypothetical protein